MDARLRRAAAKQDDLVAAWQLTGADWTWTMVKQRARHDGWRRIHDGVYALNQAPLTQRQLWLAAILTAPGTRLNAFSAGACHGFHEWRGSYETVVRPGSGGKRRYPGLVVARSSTLEGQTTQRDGIPIVTAERALVDLAPLLRQWQLSRAFRESIRLRCTTANRIARTLAGQRGTRLLVALCDRYATIPYHRCRSDAESRALEILHDAGVEPPAVNIRVNGPRPDFTWPRYRLIIEIDSEEYHQFPDEDARKQARWEDARYTVRRVAANDVYFRPERLLAAAPPNVPNWVA